ncbi:MAG: hypothetical protein U1F83_07350 [Verrucomicrobiota bacterium]
MQLAAFVAIGIVAFACRSAAQTLPLPRRQTNAPSGSSLAKHVSSLPLAEGKDHP